MDQPAAISAVGGAAGSSIRDNQCQVQCECFDRGREGADEMAGGSNSNVGRASSTSSSRGRSRSCCGGGQVGYYTSVADVAKPPAAQSAALIGKPATRKRDVKDLLSASSSSLSSACEHGHGMSLITGCARCCNRGCQA